MLLCCIGGFCMLEILKDLGLVMLGGMIGFFTAVLCTAAGKEHNINQNKI